MVYEVGFLSGFKLFDKTIDILVKQWNCDYTSLDCVFI